MFGGSNYFLILLFSYQCNLYYYYFFERDNKFFNYPARYKIVRPPDGAWGIPVGKDGDWNGMIGMVKRGVSRNDRND